MKKRNKKLAVMLLAGAMMLSSGVQVFAADTPAPVNVKTDAQVAAELGVLQGDGSGVTPGYLAKTTTRIQAAILFLRLKGLEQTALAFKGMDNFADAGTVGDSNKATMSYLKANPNLGWTGTGEGKFDPLSGVTAQQYYKVLLETLGYKQDTDFTYNDVITYAKSRGLYQISTAGALRNGHIATATVEALKAKIKGGSKTLAETLAEQKVIDAGKAALAAYARINIAKDATLGSYLVDETGKTLYFFTKDRMDTSTCKDQCAANWPIYYADNIQVSGELNGADFKTIVREDGKKQTTYKGMPLYYYVKDEKAGDVKGQGVNNVWYVVNFSTVSVSSQEDLGKFLVDSSGRTLYLYTKDSKDKSACYGMCETNWPIFYSDHIASGADLKSEDFGTIVREDGTKQTTYKGMPLYYFVKDEKAGDVKGQGVNNVWYVIEPSSSGKQAEQPKAAAGKAYAMDIAGFAFAQPEMTIEAGSSITFTNKDAVKHNVVSDATADGKPLFETPLLGKGETFTLTFDKPGEYTYFCAPHKSMMKGKIIVK
ncbi:plastocyanin/azurin family copper-binding protein [Paenibacillus allorhizosphaerae]|uniref:Plastocyanin n=1 Tax=Paenibacillus allorhizosphaerae TaxID=2849866 RepID=A0ABM8VIY0_9BACL|nr:plastocyanin/azurin family copper-binding protein [Paenibacillus allorhizosphaerae]CAG7644459.1 Plastocyanin [Paenibacillus allorhizosphaerae]